MSIRTVVEINHDFIRLALDNPEAFATALCDTLFRGGNDCFVEYAARRAGIRVLAQRHHSDGLSVSVNGRLCYDEGKSGTVQR